MEAVADPTAAEAGVLVEAADLEAAALTAVERIAAAVDSAAAVLTAVERIVAAVDSEAARGLMAAEHIAAEADTRRAAMGHTGVVLDLKADQRAGLPVRAMLSPTADGIPLETADAQRVRPARRVLGIPRLPMAGGVHSERVTVRSLETRARFPRGGRRRAWEPLA
ncbi:MAG: hypothetical protein WA020_17045 [Candidatus Acidiferrales bacterium]